MMSPYGVCPGSHTSSHTLALTTRVFNINIHSIIRIKYPNLYISASLLYLLQVSPLVKMDSKAISANIAKFAVKFCNELDKDKSVVSSPLSAEFVLALLALGTSDPAHAELLTALGIPDDDAIRSSFSSVSAKIRSLKGVTLNVANRVYVKEGPHELQPKLQEDAVKVFDAGIEKIDFAKSTAAAQQINQWVESKTNNKIKDLIAPDCLGEDTRLVLVNALYFKGTWKKKFDPQLTTPLDFHVTAKKTIQVPMMFMDGKFNYDVSDELNAEMLSMPYEGEESSLVIILPKEIEGLNNVMQKLADGYDLMKDLDRLTSPGASMKVEVTVPKFKIETELDLNTLLPKLGIKSIFNRVSSGLDKLLTPPEPLYVSKAIQKAFIEVNEEGAEAAAATAMLVCMTACIIGEPPKPRFVADRPFLAAIVTDGAPYFIATYHGPQH
ncbi:antichymotrypsin-2-like isoform X3 [Pectinophora gossypiella]|uniref:antichymotrypsin-2-like isoform X3 n=1 Tax=Pectinophora gossypiella TaxID=13191 RepID=UPI00214E8D3B|nr:antichymotrypsin-2-like isoform X3 [Pectinophora gossypiella]